MEPCVILRNSFDAAGMKSPSTKKQVLAPIQTDR